MRELSNHFAIIPADLISNSLKMGESITIPAGAEEYVCPKKVIFDQTPSESAAGISYSMTFRAVTPDQNVVRHNKSRAYIALIFTDGSIEIIGTHSSAPTIITTPYQNLMVVETSFSTPDPIIL